MTTHAQELDRYHAQNKKSKAAYDRARARLREEGKDRARRWGFPNSYTYSKGLAEQFVDPTEIRPGVVPDDIGLERGDQHPVTVVVPPLGARSSGKGATTQVVAALAHRFRRLAQGEPVLPRSGCLRGAEAGRDPGRGTDGARQLDQSDQRDSRWIGTSRKPPVASKSSPPNATDITASRSATI